MTWTADGTGAVTNTLRYGPFGETTSTTGASAPDFRYQGTWFDTTTELSWIITRWHAPSLGRFISEDTLLGEPIEPDSRHLYAYAEGEPIGRWDPDGMASLPALGTRSFTNRNRLTGRLVIGLFITVRYTEFLGNRFYGDDRSWSAPGRECLNSRGCVVIDFDKRLVTLRVNATCTDVGGYGLYGLFGCNSAFSVRKFGSCGEWLDGRCNLLSVSESSAGHLNVRWDITQSRVHVIRPDLTVNGLLVVAPGTASRGPKVSYYGEGFPSEEAYYYGRGSRATLFRHREGGFNYMADWIGNWRTERYLPTDAWDGPVRG